MGKECFISLGLLHFHFLSKYFTISVCYLDDKKGIKKKGQLELYGSLPHGCAHCHRYVCTAGIGTPKYTSSV